MSRIGKQPIAIPDTVSLTAEGNRVVVSGPKGSLQQDYLPENINLTIKEGFCSVQRIGENRVARSQHGLMRSLIANMIEGVTQGFSKQLEIIGIGYKVRLQESTLILNLGFSHEVTYQIPEDVSLTVDGNSIKIEGIDKQRVGQAAATIRGFKKPEPYKGKGIRYKGEKVRRKSGKGAKE